jgi:hypothetical protein
MTMRNAMTTRGIQRLFAGAMVLCLAGLLSGCGSMGTQTWDPTDLLDFLDTKKKAPGERKAVFPEGVPGISKGVPPDMVRGSAEARAAADAQAAAAAAPPPEPPPAAQPKGTKSAKRGPAPAPAGNQVEISSDDANVEEESTPPTPPPPPQARRQARTRTTAPPPDQQPQQQQPGAFPAPIVR